VIITSHNADYTESYFNDSLEIFLENHKHFLSGGILSNPVNRQLGY
jgi:lactate dehydrogenase-like 2-hydroxyacid dehydrogenase